MTKEYEDLKDKIITFEKEAKQMKQIGESSQIYKDAIKTSIA